MLATKILKNGSGIPLIFLHGFLGKSEDWLPICEHLPDCLCIGIDLPGHGDSPFIPEVRIPFPSFHLIGYSMGGRIALSIEALSHTLLSVHPGLKSEEERLRRLKNDEMWAKLLLELPIDEFLERWYDQSIFKPFRPNLIERRQQNIEGLAKAMLHFSLAHQKRFEVDQVLVGERDTKFRALYENPIVVPNAGHMIHLENPKWVAEIIKERVNL